MPAYFPWCIAWNIKITFYTLRWPLTTCGSVSVWITLMTSLEFIISFSQITCHMKLTWTQWVDGGTWWRHQMEIFPALLALCERNPPVTDRWISRHKGQWRGALMFSLICAWRNCWVNNRDTGDFRRHRAHYDVTVVRVPKRHLSRTNVWLS